MSGAEEWRPVAGEPGYEVSDMGRIRNVRTGRIQRAKPSSSRGSVVAHFGRGRRQLLHRVVLMAFAGPPPPGYEGSHLNGNAADNRVENLAWEDHLTNIRRKHDHGTVTRGEGVNTAKLTEEQVREIRRLRAGGVAGTVIARRFGLCHSQVYAIANGKSWKHVG